MFYCLVATTLVIVVLFNTIPTAIVYRRNRGQLSIYKSYQRARFHVFRLACFVLNDPDWNNMYASKDPGAAGQEQLRK